MSALPDYDEALVRALAGLSPLGSSEIVDVVNSAGRVIAESITADRDVPPFNRAQMDGYALRASEVGRVEAFAVCGRIAAGMPADVQVPRGSCVAIATGAALPSDVDAVIQHELSDRGDPVRFTIDTLEPGHAVHPRGADAGCGDEIIAPGTLLRAHHVGIAALVGRAQLRVTRRPRVIVISSGDEVKPVGAAVEAHQIRNSNGPMIAELLRRFGADCIDQQQVADEVDQTQRTLAEALSAADLVITIGGISAGERDCFPRAFDLHGVERNLAGALIQPGRPIITGRCAKHECVVVGLPGNPVSALACACLFVWPIVRTLLGLEPPLPWRHVRLAAAVKPNARRRAFRPARLRSLEEVVVPAWAGSGDLSHTSSTDGLVELPVQAEEVEAGTALRFLPWP